MIRNIKIPIRPAAKNNTTDSAPATPMSPCDELILVLISITTVEATPFVPPRFTIRFGISNNCKPPIMEVIITYNIIGFSIGMVIRRNCCFALAPSIADAS